MRYCVSVRLASCLHSTTMGAFVQMPDLTGNLMLVVTSSRALFPELWSPITQIWGSVN